MKIKEFRQKHSLTLVEMGQMVGVTASTVHRHETGARDPSAAVIRLYIQASAGEITSADFFEDSK